MLEQDKEQELLGLLMRKKALLEVLRCELGNLTTSETPYGTHDPFEVPLATCDNCGGLPESLQLSAPRHRPKWSVRCGDCEKNLRAPQKEKWMAALEWNSTNLCSLDYRDLPLFGLSHLTPWEASAQIKIIRSNILNRQELCSIDRSIAVFTGLAHRPGLRFRLRLDAYLKWTMLAQRLIKNARRRVNNRASEEEVESGVGI